MDTGLPGSILTSFDPPLMVALGAFVLALLSLILASRLRNKKPEPAQRIEGKVGHPLA